MADEAQALEHQLELLRRVFTPGPFLDRRLGRAFAFQALYEMDLAHHPPAQVLQRLAEAIDGVIQERAPLWPLAQMSAVDRNVLRIGLYESLFGNATVPLRTAINEAVELAKLFGSETSAKFVNGVLGRAVEANATAEAPQ